MKYLVKFSGKRKPWAEASPQTLKEWTFERRAGGWVIATHAESGKRHRFFYSRSKQQFWAKLQYQNTALDLYGERIPEQRAGSKSDSGSDFTAQFPGKVRKILVQEGQKVTENIPLLMIEAMKMEFPIKSSVAGVVKKVLVTEGQILTPGQKLLDFEVAVEVKNETKEKSSKS